MLASVILLGTLASLPKALAATAWVSPSLRQNDHAYCRGLPISLTTAHADVICMQRFSAPASSPTEQSANYTGFSNNTLQDTNVVEGKVCDAPSPFFTPIDARLCRPSTASSRSGSRTPTMTMRSATQICNGLRLKASVFTTTSA